MSKTQEPLAELQQRSKFLAWLIKHRGLLVYIGLGILVALVAINRMVGSQSTKRETDYRDAEHYAAVLLSDRPDTLEALAQLEQILSKHTELHQRYDGMIAQSLLQQEHPEGKRYSQRAFDRISAADTPYLRYSKTTLLIADHGYEQALLEAIALRDELDPKQMPHSHLLELHNLLRIAMLQQLLANEEGEREAWDHFLSVVEKSRAKGLLLNIFQQGNTNLISYAKARLEDLPEGAAP